MIPSERPAGGSGPPDPAPDPARPDRMGVAAAAAVLLLGVVLAVHPVATPDFFWHLAAGDWILREGRVPRTDPFSYTAAGRPWIDLHWGFQVLQSLLFRASGFDGVTAVRALLTAALTGLLVFGFPARTRGGICLAGSLLAVLAAHERFLFRPELVSFLLLGAYLILLERGIRCRSLPALFLLLPVQVVWVNVHSLFLLGPILAVLALAGEVADRMRARWGPLRPETAGRIGLAEMAGVLVALTLACLVNPFGPQAFGLPLVQFTGRIAPGGLYAATIAEFQQPFDPSVGTAAILAAWALAAAVIGVAAVQARRLPTRHLLTLAAFLLLAWRARRNLPLFAIAVMPLWNAAWDGFLLPFQRVWQRPGLRLAARAGVLGAAVLLSISVATDRFYLWSRLDRRFGSGVLDGIAPYGAADFLAARALPGNLFHSLEDGGYLQWRLHPQTPVFIDGRLEVHSEDTFAGYLRALEDPARFEDLVRRYDIRTVLWSHSGAPRAWRLLRYLHDSAEWRPVYLDRVSVLFRRAPGEAAGEPPPLELAADPPAEVLGRGLPASTALDGILRRLQGGPALPVAEIRLGLLFLELGEAAPAESYLLQAASARVVPAEVHYDLGLLYEGTGRWEKAMLQYEEARQATSGWRDPVTRWLRPGFRREILFRLGEACLRSGLEERGAAFLERAGSRGRARLRARQGFRLQERGEIPAAIEAYRESLRMHPGDPDVLHNHGLALIADAVTAEAAGGDPEERIAEAVHSFQEAIRARPDFASAHLNLGILLLEQGRSAEGLAALEEAVRLEPGNPEFRLRLGVTRSRAGQLGAAEAELSEAVRLSPDRAEAVLRLGLVRAGRGDSRGAIEAFRRCLELGWGDPRLHLEIARLYAALGEEKQAQEWIRGAPLPAAGIREWGSGHPDLAPLIDRALRTPGPSVP